VDKLAGVEVFAQVVEAKSFSAAAENLGISKSLVSRQVSALEQALAVKLLNRSTRKLSLTEAGSIYYEHCANILREAALAQRRLAQTQAELSGVVKVTAVPAFATRHVLPALVDFRRQFPKIHVRLSCSNRTVNLGEEGFDVAIRAAFKPDPHLVARKLADSRAVLCAAPAYLAQHGTPRKIEDLAQHDCINFSPLYPKRVWHFRRNGHRHEVTIAGSFETDDMEAVYAATRMGLGISLLPAHIAGSDLRQGELVALLRAYESEFAAGIYVTYLSNRTMPSRVRAFIDFMVARFTPQPPWEVGWS
jgi:DNA-binding transcriptional LysR family regulator